MNKVTELIKGKEELSYSFEVTPDVQEDEIRNVSVDPLFFTVTWHSKSHKCEGLNIAPVRMACLLASMKKDVLLHLSCDMLRKAYLDELLNKLQEEGVCNLFLVLGEGYDPTSSDFKNTSHLVKYIREKTGQYFCIGVAAFPGCSEDKLSYTKEKVDNGADFLITQAFFDAAVYAEFKERCEKIGINAPIIPGIYAFETHKQLTGFINMCKIKVSSDLLQYIENKEKFSTSCIEITQQLIQNLSAKCGVNHFNFFTLNKFECICKLLERLKHRTILPKGRTSTSYKKNANT